MTVYLDRADIPANILAGIDYAGRKWHLEAREAVSIGHQQWSGGTRSLYFMLDLASGEVRPLDDPREWPANMYDAGQVHLRPGFAVVERVIFNGKDFGVRLTVHPNNATGLLPPAAALEMDRAQRLVLTATKSFKSHHAGRDRYQMATEGYNCPFANVTREQWEVAKKALVVSGHLNRAGAITTRGRNAVEQFKTQGAAR